MAIRNFINNAVQIKDVWTITCGGTFAAADTITIPINGKNLVITLGTAVATTDVAVAIKNAWQSETLISGSTVVPQGGGTSVPEMNELTATVATSVATFTGKVAGLPHTIGTPTTTSGAGTVTLAHPTVATGKFFGDNVANWLEGAVPVDADDIVINGPYRWLYGASMAAIQPASITFGDRCTGVTQFGLPWANALGYNEYRSPEILIGPLIVNVRGPVGLVKVNAGADPMTVNVYNSGTSLDAGYAPVQCRGTHATLNVVNAYGGNTSVAARGETAVLLAARQTGSGRLTIGNNVAFTTISGTATVMAD